MCMAIMFQGNIISPLDVRWWMAEHLKYLSALQPCWISSVLFTLIPPVPQRLDLCSLPQQ